MNREAALQVLATPLAQELLHSELLFRLAYVGPDGYPRVVPMGYIWKGGRFVVCTASNAPKVKALQSNPRVALTIDTQTQPPHILLVRGSAAVEVVDGVPDEYLEASRRYVPRQEWSAFETRCEVCTIEWLGSALPPNGQSSSTSRQPFRVRLRSLLVGAALDSPGLEVGLGRSGAVWEAPVGRIRYEVPRKRSAPR